MAVDYYKALGVARNASHADIQKAYRELARKHHPDMNPDKPGSVKKFQEIQAAFDILNNPEKREKYDRYGSSFETMGEGAPQNPSWGAEPGGGFSPEDIDFGQFFGERFGEGGAGPGDIFSHFRRAAGRNGDGTSAKRRGGDATAEVTIPFGTAVSGGETPVQPPPTVRRNGDDRSQDSARYERRKDDAAPWKGRTGFRAWCRRQPHAHGPRGPSSILFPQGQRSSRPPAGYVGRGRGWGNHRRAHAQRDGLVARSAGNFQRQEAAGQGAWRGAKRWRRGRLAGRGLHRASRQSDGRRSGIHPPDRCSIPKQPAASLAVVRWVNNGSSVPTVSLDRGADFPRPQSRARLRSEPDDRRGCWSKTGKRR